MKMTIQNRGVPLSAASKRDFRERIRSGLEPFGDRILRVSVWFDDDNGPRGGIDQVCRIQVTMAPRMVAFGEARERETSRALQVALGRVQGRVKQMLERRRQHDARRVSEFDEAGRESA
jgi:hypothetical protein